MNLTQTEIELKKRWAIPYTWGRKQYDSWDKDTNFIYGIDTYEEVANQIYQRFENASQKEALTNFAWNRWYNFQSAMAIEYMFVSHPKVQKVWNAKDREKDFFIDGIPFDHKTSVFPKQFDRTLDFALSHPKELAKWLYINQSKEQRFHIKNRLFIVLHNSTGEHWKLKAELNWLEELIINYLDGFESEKLITLTHKNGSLLTDVLFARR